MPEPVSAGIQLASTVIPVVGDLLGGLIGDKGQREANLMNLRIAREQMAFQERMSSTAHQRSAADLEAAGLNRILALGRPASSPPGQSAVMQNPRSHMARGVSNAAHSAVAVARQVQEIKNLQASERQTNQQTDNLGLQNLILQHGEAVAWIAGTGARVLREIMGDMTPKQVADWIIKWVNDRSKDLSQAMTGTGATGAAAGRGVEQAKQDIIAYLTSIGETAGAPMTYRRKYQEYLVEENRKDITPEQARKNAQARAKQWLVNQRKNR